MGAMEMAMAMTVKIASKKLKARRRAKKAKKAKSLQIVAQEIVRSLVATIGLVAAVPVTTALAALVARGRW